MAPFKSGYGAVKHYIAGSQLTFADVLEGSHIPSIDTRCAALESRPDVTDKSRPDVDPSWIQSAVSGAETKREADASPSDVADESRPDVTDKSRPDVDASWVKPVVPEAEAKRCSAEELAAACRRRRRGLVCRHPYSNARSQGPTPCTSLLGPTLLKANTT